MRENKDLKKITNWKPHTTTLDRRPEETWEDQVLNDMRKLEFRNWRQQVRWRKLRNTRTCKDSTQIRRWSDETQKRVQ
ncbi:hypothetical protein WA026_003582 [Henosepilachna vigintioctopunctata]|uniref:Uncharacterized protein n=1 Tax=Henosepilachna vigintioctopunctata TaxID=420089 RepID=A0AAW1TNI3_9CUCU